jgi:hypothetical protein
MRLPMRYTANNGFVELLTTTSVGFDDGRWAPSRPLDGGPFWQRWKLAWAVFTGRADALFWVRQ